MVNSRLWPIKTVDVVNLSLDTENVRLRSVDPYESDVILYLYEYEDVLSLANQITHDGFFDNDLPIVFGDGKKLVVLEGNRRIAALKGLANPTVVPRFKSQLSELRSSMSAEQLSQLQSVRVIEAPNREEVQLVLASLHTRNPKRSWPLDQQASFYYAQLGPTVSVKDLQLRYPSVAQKIPRFIRMAEMYDLVRKSELGESTLKDFVESKNFKMSVFERLYSSEDFRKGLGVTFQEDGHIKVTGKKASINRVLERVVLDMKTGFLDTRRLGTQGSKNFQEYVSSLQIEVPRSKGNGERTAGAAGNARTTSHRIKRKSNLDAADLVFGLNSPSLERRFLELKTIDVVSFPNATMDLLRTVLECALKQYLSESGDAIPKQSGKPVTLATGLAHAQLHFKSNRGLLPIIAALRNSRPVDEGQFSKSSEALNAVNHNPDVFFSPEQVRETWDHVRPLMKILVAGAATD